MNPWTDVLQHPIVFCLGLTLLHFVWHGAIVGVVAWMLPMALRGCSAQTRYVTLLVLLAPNGMRRV